MRKFFRILFSNNKLETPMSDNVNVENGNASAATSIVLGIMTWLTPENAELGLKVLVAIGSIITAIMAIRYYYFATIHQKNKIKKDEYDD